MAAVAAVVAGGAALVVAAPLALTGLVTVAASAAASPPSPVTLGPGVPEAYRADLMAAHERCPRLPPSLLAAQVEAESGWNPNARSPVGAQGLAQFMPGTWATWGGDLDEDGTNSPTDPGDALRAQADFMCHLLDVVMEAGLGDGDPVAVIGLALAGYNAGPGAVRRYRGVPPYPETQAYVRSVFELAASDKYALGLAEDTAAPADVPAGGVDAMLPAGYHNERTAAHAVASALGQVGVWRDAGYCLRFVESRYQRPWDGASIPEAHHVWDNSPPAMHHRGYDAPRGAIVLWNDSIGGGAGHIAISLGNGQMVTTTRGAVSIRRIRGFSDHAYLGWMPPYFRSR